MVKILDRDSRSILMKITLNEYKKLKAINFIEDNTNDYEMVFNKPIKASDLLKTF